MLVRDRRSLSRAKRAKSLSARLKSQLEALEKQKIRASGAKGKKLQEQKTIQRGQGQPKLQGLLPANTALRVMYKSQVRKARVDAKGRIVIDGRTFDSPSQAGSFIRGGRSTNGWTFWRYRNAKGEWVLLDKARRK